ncbi:MAG: ROK family protein [Patescibacteria group bacterium]|nr:ROK family protein [Patescibacteria group bacterium]
MDVFVGVDCGATNLRVGLVDKSGKLLESVRIGSPLRDSSQNLADIIKEQLQALTTKQKGVNVLGLGLGTPGPLDLEKGLILPSSNIGNSSPIDLKSQFKTVFDVPVSLGRDTDIALIGEQWLGEAGGLKDVVMLSLGTGVGGSVIIDGRPYRGFSGKGGEIGHMIIQADADSACGLGHRGCLEAMINSAPDLDRFAFYLALGLANVINIFNPQKIILGGGKLSIGDFLPKTIEMIKSSVVRESMDDVQIVYAKLKDLSGVYGAARLAMTGKIDGGKHSLTV